jgi:hypothetical protein
MKALVLDAPRQLRVGDWPDPKCGPRDVVLRPIAAGICAGDLQHYAGLCHSWAGLWTRYQLSAWRELRGVEWVAICNRTAPKAEAIAREFGIAAVYNGAEKLLREVKPDFVDNITRATSRNSPRACGGANVRLK